MTTSKIKPKHVIQQMTGYVAPMEGRHTQIRLDFNENTTGFPAAYYNLPPTWITSYPEYEAFIAQLSAAWAMSGESLMLTNGSDEALFLVPFTFIEAGQDRAVISQPTFSMIPHYLTVAEAIIQEVLITADFQFDIPAIEQALHSGAKLAIFSTPDNPVGCVLSSDQIKHWCQAYPNTLFVIDEAYIEYTQDSVISSVLVFDNLLVTRTFSKAWGLAGLRLGVVAGHPDLLNAMKIIRSPYSVNMAAIASASQLLEQEAQVKQQVQETLALKETVLAELSDRGYGFVKGHANFFLLSMGLHAPAFTQFCEARGILIRDRSTVPQLWGKVRVSIGTAAEINQFLACLDDFQQQHVVMFDLDDTLVDTSQSYDATIETLIQAYAGSGLQPGELKSIRAEGGFNDDWSAACELLKRRGYSVGRDEVETKGKAIYLSLARQTETLLLETELLAALKDRYRLIIVTGRPRDEYEPVWHQDFQPHFEQVYCQGDFEGALGKPAPDMLLKALKAVNATSGVYIGNSVDDMRAAKSAGLTAVGVTSTHEEALLFNAGAHFVYESINVIGKVLLS